MKKHSCCAAQHVTIEVLLQLMADNRLRYEDVESVQLYVSRHTADLLRADLPNSKDPRNGAETRFSLHHGHAVALADGETSFRAFTDVGAKAPKYREARRKINVIAREAVAEGCVELKLMDGRTLAGGREMLKGDPKGGPTNPFTAEELIARHEALARDALSPKQIQRSIDLVLNLEKLADISELMELATFGGMTAAA
jgi:2-methylcitrate dehydratase PrpD